MITSMRIIRLFVFLGLPLAAQWVNLPTAGIPRTRDGKPDLTAAAPKTSAGKPDFSGMWIPREILPCNSSERGVQCTELPLTPQILNIAAGMKDGLPYQPWAADLFKSRSKDVAYIDPHMHCMPPNFPRAWAFPETIKIFQTAAQLVILDEFNASYRQVFFDGRKLPDDMVPTWNGYSIAHWEGDTLVVETTNNNGKVWMNESGDVISYAATAVERFTAVDADTIDYKVTITDPVVMTRPYTLGFQMRRQTGEILEVACHEDNQDLEHLKHVKDEARKNGTLK